MRTSATLLALISAVTLSASAFAAPTITADAGSPAMAAVQTIQGANQKIRATDVDGITGVYMLSDGQTLRVSFAQRKLFAEMGTQKTELVPHGRNSFASRGGDLKLVFDELPIADAVTVSRN